MKDFYSEVRPAVDVWQLIEQSVFLLDENVDQTSPMDLVELLLGKLKLSPVEIEEAIKMLLVHDKGINKMSNRCLLHFLN